MKILVISQYFWPENFRVNDLVVEFKRRGHEVTILTGLPNYPLGKVFPEYRDNPAGFDSFEGMPVIRVPLVPRGLGGLRLMLNYASFMISASVLGLFKLRGRRFDSIFVFQPSPITVGVPAVVLSFFKKTPVVLWVLDLWPETLSAMGVIRRPRLLALVGRLVRFIYNRCSLVLGQSPSFVTSIAKYCDQTEKILYFPSWAESVYDDSTPVPAPEVAYRPGAFNIVFAGNIGEAQDMPALLTAAESLRGESSVRWLIIGDGRKSEWLAHEVSRRQLQGSVKILGRFPVERMPSFYAHADALLVTLKKDPVFAMTVPGKVQSYLTAGIPLLGMLDGEGARVIQDSRSGLCAPAGNGLALAESVLKLKSMSIEERRRMGERGREFARLEYDRDTLISQLLDLLESQSKNHQKRSGV